MTIRRRCFASVDDVSVVEGDAGIKTVTFTISSVGPQLSVR